MFTSRTFLIFMIPLVIFGLFLWFITSLDLDRSNVKVGGALVGADDMEISVLSSRLEESNGARRLIVEMEGRNTSPANLDLNPKGFKLVLASNEDPANPTARQSIYNPMNYSSVCEQAPASVSSIPPNAVRSMTLVFWGENLPRGDEWDDYHLSLEYYDVPSHIMISRLINPTEE
ncbi:MAG: hypothetical protein AB1384_12685 [Actinomycetota bacterium]